MLLIRRGEPRDLASLEAIQLASPGAAVWDVSAYLAYDLLVAEMGPTIAGFLCARKLADDECELLNIAVAPGQRRHGIGASLLREYLRGFSGTVFLEVRRSNLGAQKFYKSLNFQEISVRKGYYSDPCEDGVVMKLLSC